MHKSPDPTYNKRIEGRRGRLLHFAEELIDQQRHDNIFSFVRLIVAFAKIIVADLELAKLIALPHKMSLHHMFSFFGSRGRSNVLFLALVASYLAETTGFVTLCKGACQAILPIEVRPRNGQSLPHILSLHTFFFVSCSWPFQQKCLV